MSKRDLLLDLVNNPSPSRAVPAAFFMHFDPAYHRGPAAVEKHLAFFRTTGMDFVKIQYEQVQPPPPTPIRTPYDWTRLRPYPPEFFEAPIQVAQGLVRAARAEALVIMTLYSPLMWAAQLAPGVDLAEHLSENPAAVQHGLEVMTENVIRLARGCLRAGVDGFYASTQGGEADRFRGTDFFERYIKPTDLAVWEAIGGSTFNILHVCDYQGAYDNLSPFLDYPGQVVNCSLQLGGRRVTPREVSQWFGRPFMGGLERLGILASGSATEIRRAAEDVLARRSERFILAADCTVPSGTPWDNLKIAIEAAHAWRD